MVRGRPPTGAALVDRLDGSPQAKHRLELILRTLAGQVSIPQACAELHIGTSRFHQMRTEVIQEALDALEPRPRGRPPTLPSPQEARIEALADQVQSLKADLRAAQIREELATLLPTLNRHPEPDGRGGGKKSRRRTRRR